METLDVEWINSPRLIREVVQLDFGGLQGKLPNKKANFQDIDGLLERRGKFLYLEAKFEGNNLTLSQEILIQNFTKLSKNTVAFIVETKKLAVMERPGLYKFYPVSVVFCQNGVYSPKYMITPKEFVGLVCEWWMHAENNSALPNYIT